MYCVLWWFDNWYIITCRDPMNGVVFDNFPQNICDTRPLYWVWWATLGMFGRGKFGKFGESSVICQIKTIQISTNHILANLYICQTFFDKIFVNTVLPPNIITNTFFLLYSNLLWNTAMKCACVVFSCLQLPGQIKISENSW